LWCNSRRDDKNQTSEEEKESEDEKEEEPNDEPRDKASFFVKVRFRIIAIQKYDHIMMLVSFLNL